MIYLTKFKSCIYELPWKYEYSNNNELAKTLEQNQAIISFAEWQVEEEEAYRLTTRLRHY